MKLIIIAISFILFSFNSVLIRNNKQVPIKQKYVDTCKSKVEKNQVLKKTFENLIDNKKDFSN